MRIVATPEPPPTAVQLQAREVNVTLERERKARALANSGDDRSIHVVFFHHGVGVCR